MERDLKMKRNSRDKSKRKYILTSNEEESSEELAIVREIRNSGWIQRKVKEKPIESKEAESASESGSEREELCERSKSGVAKRAARRERFEETTRKGPRAQKTYAASSEHNATELAEESGDARANASKVTRKISVWRRQADRAYRGAERTKVARNTGSAGVSDTRTARERRESTSETKCKQKFVRTGRMSDVQRTETLEELKSNIAERIENLVTTQNAHEHRLKRLQLAQIKLTQLEEKQRRQDETAERNRESTAKLEAAIEDIDARITEGHCVSRLRENARIALENETITISFQYKDSVISEITPQVGNEENRQLEATAEISEVDTITVTNQEQIADADERREEETVISHKNNDSDRDTESERESTLQVAKIATVTFETISDDEPEVMYQHVRQETVTETCLAKVEAVLQVERTLRPEAAMRPGQRPWRRPRAPTRIVPFGKSRQLQPIIAILGDA
ncbi:PREDICTED: uncharacterized protein LOC108760109 [Trachymyrmex cornetzi]|uniref:uncharacterized protein LOC108760109 n=1 Tax=Trachymyrmex cornetzi TaxID=471704 RepID=UPI00084EFD3C|nr:PREDICTED: uncharacterized protein LOC108760109 [Trachymyrmex cornetzi]